MLKTLNTLVLLATVSCGYTSNLNSQNSLNNITNNNNIINNNVHNVNVINTSDNNNISNNQYLGKKRLFIVHKCKKQKNNNAYKYLFRKDIRGKYFKDETSAKHISNPKYRCFMKGVYNIFDYCLITLIGNNPEINLRDDYNIQLLKNIKLPIRKLIPVAQICDTFRFCDKQNYKLDNNNVYNLNKYIEKYKNTSNDSISFYEAYKYYLYNHIVKLYQQATNAIVKSINNKEQANNQIEIVNELGKVIKNILNEFSDIINGILDEIHVDINNDQEDTNNITLTDNQSIQQDDSDILGNSESISEEQQDNNTLLSYDSQSMQQDDSDILGSSESISEGQQGNSTLLLSYDSQSMQQNNIFDLLDCIIASINFYCIPNLEKRINEFNYDTSNLSYDFNELLYESVISKLNKIINSNKEYNIIINNVDDCEIINSNKEYIEKLLKGLNIGSNSDIKKCKKFFVKGENNIPVKEYIKKLVTQLNVLKNITDQKIKYQIENEYKFTFDTSIYYYFKILKNSIQYLEQKCKCNHKILILLKHINTGIFTSLLSCNDFTSERICI